MPLLLSPEEAAAISFIIDCPPLVSRDAVSEHVSEQVQDALLARGYIRWVGGMLVVTSEGLRARQNRRETAN